MAHSYIRYSGDLAGPFIHNVAKNLVGIGDRIHVLAPHNRGLASLEIIDRVKIHRFRYAPVFWERLAYEGNMDEKVKGNLWNLILFFFFLLFFLVSSISLVKKKRIDILYAHWWIPGGLVGLVTSWFTKRPLLVTLHGTDYRVLKKQKFLRPLAKCIFKQARHVTVVSSFIKEHLLESQLASEEKIKVLPMPVDDRQFVPQKLSKKEKKTILCVAKFTRQKGLDYLIDASSILLDKGLDFEVKIIGGGPEWDRFENKIRDLGLSQQVFLLDKVRQQELPSYYKEADVIVLPAIEEGFGLVLVEAQLCLRPVIGARSGGIPDIIEDGKSGLLVPPKDHLSLASAIHRVLTDEQLAVRLAQGGYESAKEKFSSRAVLREYLKLLR